MELHILFDLDGTLTDPKHGITRSMQYALEKLDEPVPDTDDLLWCIGPPLQENFLKLLNKPTDDLVWQAVTYYRERFATIGKFENEVYPAIPKTLENLRQTGYHLYIATSKPLVYTLDIAKHFELTQYFDGVFGSELDGRLRNKADLIAHILNTQGIDSSQCIMVGDRKHDILGAKANAVQSIGITYGYGSQEELAEAGATYIVDTPVELPEVINKVAMVT